MGRLDVPASWQGLGPGSGLTMAAADRADGATGAESDGAAAGGAAAAPPPKGTPPTPLGAPLAGAAPSATGLLPAGPDAARAAGLAPSPPRAPAAPSSTTRTTVPSRCTRCWPAETTRSPVLKPSTTSTKPGRRAPRVTGVRWVTRVLGSLPSTIFSTNGLAPSGTTASSGITRASARSANTVVTRANMPGRNCMRRLSMQPPPPRLGRPHQFGG